MRQIPESCCVPGPNRHVLALIKKYEPKRYAEIGVYKGDTAIEVAKSINSTAQIHLFDFENRLNDLLSRLRNDKDLLTKDLKIYSWPNTHKMFDSYNWNLAKCLEQGQTFDFVYIDGAHSWHHDALAFLLIDRILEDGGIVVFDDYGWCFKGSPTMNPGVFPEITEQYTDEQIERPQINMVIDLLVEKSDNYRCIIPKVAYQKVG